MQKLKDGEAVYVTVRYDSENRLDIRASDGLTGREAAELLMMGGESMILCPGSQFKAKKHERTPDGGHPAVGLYLVPAA